MSKLYAEIKTERGNSVSRAGQRTIETHTRGWDVGVRVSCNVIENNQIEIIIYRTGGSKNPSNLETITEIIR